MGVHSHAGPLERHIRPRASGLTDGIYDRVLQLQRTKVRMGDGGMTAAEIASQCCARSQLRRPIDPTRRGVELFGVAHVEAPQLEENTIRDSRLETCAICGTQRSRKGNARGAFLDMLRAKRR